MRRSAESEIIFRGDQRADPPSGAVWTGLLFTAAEKGDDLQEQRDDDAGYANRRFV